MVSEFGAPVTLDLVAQVALGAGIEKRVKRAYEKGRADETERQAAENAALRARVEALEPVIRAARRVVKSDGTLDAIPSVICLRTYLREMDAALATPAPDAAVRAAERAVIEEGMNAYTLSSTSWTGHKAPLFSALVDLACALAAAREQQP